MTRDGVSDPGENNAELGCTALAPLYLDILSGASECGSKHEADDTMTISICANGASNEPSNGVVVYTGAEYGIPAAIPFLEVLSLVALRYYIPEGDSGLPDIKALLVSVKYEC